jgi:SAM-dependent methyltransferase
MVDSSRPQQLTSRDLWGKALWDYHTGAREVPLILHTSFGPPEKVPIDVFFRDKTQLSDLEAYTLELCKGTVLDIGAGTGCHVSILQEAGYHTMALEMSKGACRVMKDRGIQRVFETDIFNYHGTKFHTALLMMNGLGIAGYLNQLPFFLEKVASAVEPGGQILADSSDIDYMYEKKPANDSIYYGELFYTYEYLGERDPTFPWLFVDMDRLKYAGEKVGLQTQILFEEDDQYLARMIRV